MISDFCDSMVVLAGSICTRGGKPLLSRQFRELSKDRVTSLLSNFPTLLSKSTKTQFTSVEDEFVRYVYQPLEEFYVVLITNKHSNIIEDIDTLHLFAQTITSIVGTIDEREIFDNCFEIINAFDEIVNLGYKENLTLSQIVTFLEMESHEEKIQEIIERNKELEAAEERKRKATEIFLSKTAADIRNREMLRKANTSSFGEGPTLLGQQDYQQANYPRQAALVPQQEEPKPLGGSHFRQAVPRRGGLQLGKKKRIPSSGFGLGDSEPLISDASSGRPSTYVRGISSSPAVEPEHKKKAAVPNKGILVISNEKVGAQITRDGTISSADIKGDLQIRINDSKYSHAKLQLSVNELDGTKTQFKTHPNIDGPAFRASHEIKMKNSGKAFPSNDQTLGVLRWKSVPNAKNSDENVLLPLMITTWVNNNNDGTITLTFEYERNASSILEQLAIIIPTSNATIDSSDNDNVTLDYADEGLHVNLTGIAENPEGSFAITCKDVDDEEALFPMEVSFDITKQLDNGERGGLVGVNEVENTESGESLPFDSYYKLTSEGFYII